MNHARFQSSVASLTNQPTPEAVRQEALTIARDWLNTPAVGLYKKVGEQLRLVTATESAREWCPEVIQSGTSEFENIITTGEPVSGEPPAVFETAGTWCGASTGRGGLLFGVTAESTEFEQRVETRLSHLAVVAGMAYQNTSAVGSPESQQAPSESDFDDELELPQVFNDTFPDYGFLYDREGTYLDVVLGEQAASLYTAEELTGAKIQDVLDSDTARLVQEAVETTIDREESQTIRYSLQTPAGERTYEGNISPVTTNGTTRAVLVARDITDRVQRKSELAEIREQTEFALETTESLTWKIDLDSGELRSLRGSPQAVIDERIESFGGVTEHIERVVHPEDREDVRAAFEAVTEGVREEVHVEYRVELGDETRWISADGYVREETDGSRYLVGLATDETARKEWERQLTALRGVAHEITNADSVDEICRRTITAAEDILNFSACLVSIVEDDMLVPRATSGEVSPDDYEEKSIQDGVAGETYRTGESFLIADQHAHPVAETTDDSPYRSLLSVPVGDHGNFQAADTAVGAFDERDVELAEILGTYAETALDLLTSRRELELKNERLEEFASLVSHDLRNPLNVAQGRAELVSNEVSSPHLEKITDAHDRMEALIDDLLTLARTGNESLDRSSVSLDTLATQCWSLVDTAESELRVETSCEVEADRQQLQRLFENLFRNAVEHGGETVTVTVGQTDGGFYVADDGPGFETSDTEEIFDAGYTTAQDGTGFGLKIVRGVARNHGWQVTAEESEAGGARFSFDL